MLSPVLLLKPQNTTASLLFQKSPLAQNTWTNRIQSHITHIITHFNPPNPYTSVSIRQYTSSWFSPSVIYFSQYTSVVHHPTTSFNPILIRSNTTPPFCHLVTQICWSLYRRSWPASLEQTPASIATNIWPILRAHSYRSPCHLFHSELKTLLFSKSDPDSLSSPYLPPVSTPSTIHHSRLTVCLPDSLDLDRCLSILFWLRLRQECFEWTRTSQQNLNNYLTLKSTSNQTVGTIC